MLACLPSSNKRAHRIVLYHIVQYALLLKYAIKIKKRWLSVNGETETLLFAFLECVYMHIDGVAIALLCVIVFEYKFPMQEAANRCATQTLDAHAFNALRANSNQSETHFTLIFFINYPVVLMDSNCTSANIF